MRQATSKAVAGSRANCRLALSFAAGSLGKQTLDTTKASLTAYGCAF